MNSLVLDHSILLRLVLLCICFSKIIDAGKGKVPVYMPIPIPVPMPLPHPGAGKFQQQQHHHHHHQNDDEGEVKKIYLLQPVSKVNQEQQQQQHHDNAGFMQRQHFDSNSHQAANYHSQQAPKSADMKILPIVVIPPIAPMPPIHIRPNRDSHDSRMMFSPQFNNYLLSSSEPTERSGAYQHHIVQDQKTFSDYGGSGGGAMYRRERQRLRSRNTGARLGGARTRMQDDYNGEDYDYNPAPSIRSSGTRRLPPRRRYRNLDDNRSLRSPNKLTSNSIRDILDVQKGIFDDDPILDIGESKELSIKAAVAETKKRQLAGLEAISDYDTEKDYLESGGSRGGERSSSQSTKQNELNSLYYDRDLHVDEPGRLSIKYIPSNTNSGKRLYLDDREVFEDDEWRFDTIKSVTHLSPNATTSTTNNSTNIPPINITKT